MTTNAFFVYPKVIHRLHEGPLGPYIDAYAADLLEQGFSRSKARRNLRLAAHLSRWLQAAGLGTEEFDELALQRYRRSRARSKPFKFGDRLALRNLIDLLRKLDVCRPPPLVPPSPDEVVEKDYKRYLLQDIGLSVGTSERYSDLIRQFLQEQLAAGPRWSQLSASDVVDFFQRCARRRSPQYVQRLGTALRSFLRYLQYCGEIRTDLSGCVPSVTRWRLATIPKYLSPSQVQDVLNSCDCTIAIGKRNYAILLLLIRLGLRAKEVATLALDDIDWRSGLLTLQTKNAEQALMPLPFDVGDTIADYLQNARPRSHSRRVFLRHNAPHVGFSRANVSAIVNTALVRAGVDVPCKGAHVLRHTLATQMLRNGASLRQIGHVLRHRQLDTTRIYAKVDLSALRSVAQPWPEAVQ